jgi:hypothetical protein
MISLLLTLNTLFTCALNESLVRTPDTKTIIYTHIGKDTVSISPIPQVEFRYSSESCMSVCDSLIKSLPLQNNELVLQSEYPFGTLKIQVLDKDTISEYIITKDKSINLLVNHLNILSHSDAIDSSTFGMMATLLYRISIGLSSKPSMTISVDNNIKKEEVRKIIYYKTGQRDKLYRPVILSFRNLNMQEMGKGIYEKEDPYLFFCISKSTNHESMCNVIGRDLYEDIEKHIQAFCVNKTNKCIIEESPHPDMANMPGSIRIGVYEGNTKKVFLVPYPYSVKLLTEELNMLWNCQTTVSNTSIPNLILLLSRISCPARADL